jgi:hypothetical protein
MNASVLKAFQKISQETEANTAMYSERAVFELTHHHKQVIRSSVEV